MSRLFLLGASLIVVCIVGTVAWADEPQVHPNVAKLFFLPQVELLLSFEDDDSLQKPAGDSLGSSLLSPLDQKAISVVTSVVEKKSRILQRLLSAEEHRVFGRFLSTSYLSDNKLASEGEDIFRPFPKIVERYKTNQYFLLQFNLKAWEQGSYGAAYRYAGKDFKPEANLSLQSDQEGFETWGSWQFGVARLKTSLTEFWDNVDEEPHRPRVTTMQGKVGIDIALPSWPLFSLSYIRGSAESAQEPEGFTPEKHRIEAIGAALYYGHSTWKATLSSTYSLTQDRLQPGEETLTFHHALSASYRPTSALTIVPTLSLSEERHQPSPIRTTTPSAALLLTYSPLFDVFEFTAYSSHSRTKSSDGLVDTRVINTTTSLNWNLEKSLQRKATLSFDVTYYRSLDSIYPSSSSEGLSGGLFLKIAFL